MNVGAHSISVTAATGTNLDDYVISFSDNCSPDGTVLIAGTPIPIPGGYQTTCTVTISRSGPQLTVNTFVYPSNDRGRFNIKIDGVPRARNVGHGGTTESVDVNVGAHTVGVTAVPPTNLDRYMTTIAGDCAPDGTITLGHGDKKTCVIILKPKTSALK